MLFFVSHGHVIAHDRRGHGRSSRVADGHDLDHYVDDLAAVTAHLVPWRHQSAMIASDFLPPVDFAAAGGMADMNGVLQIV